MKKILLLLGCVLLMTSMTGCCDHQTEIDALNVRLAEYAAYDEIIGYIERHEYERAKELLDAYSMQQRNEQIQNRQLRTITVTTENWAEYFEIEELTEWCENDLGETTGFITHVCAVLREEYASCVAADETKIDFQWQGRCSVKNCSVDTANHIVSIENVFGSNATTFGDPETLSGTFSFDGQLYEEGFLAEKNVVGKIGEIVLIGEYSLNGEMKPVCYDYEDVTMLQVQGVLTLKP